MKPKLSTLTPSQIRIMVAEEMGWKYVKYDRDYSSDGYDIVGVPILNHKFGDTPTAYLRTPNYPEDLNACAEFERTMNSERKDADIKSELEIYRENLCVITIGCGGPISASALQRCQAFLLVKGKVEL